MNLQFKPQMYLDECGRAGRATTSTCSTGSPRTSVVELDIENLDFNGLIPGLQSQEVRHGLGRPHRHRRAPAGHRLQPRVRPLRERARGARGRLAEPSIDTYNVDDNKITALQGSSGEQLAKDTFPNAKVDGFPDQNAALLAGRHRPRAGLGPRGLHPGAVPGANPGQLKEAELPEPLAIGYGCWAVQKGNSALRRPSTSSSAVSRPVGRLADAYEEASVSRRATSPTMPAGC